MPRILAFPALFLALFFASIAGAAEKKKVIVEEASIDLSRYTMSYLSSIFFDDSIVVDRGELSNPGTAKAKAVAKPPAAKPAK